MSYVTEFARMWIRLGGDELKSVDYMNVSEDAETGYILELDLEYPAEIHDQHNDYPMAPEK